jgi:hypothetical protein
MKATRRLCSTAKQPKNQPIHALGSRLLQACNREGNSTTARGGPAARHATCEAPGHRLQIGQIDRFDYDPID